MLKVITTNKDVFWWKSYFQDKSALLSWSVQLSIKIICQNASSDAEHYVASSKENETILQYQVKYRFKLCPE